MIDVPAVVRNKARAAGAEDWLERLPALVSSLEADWSITVGHPYEGGTEAFVADATRADGTPAVLKVLVPGTGNNASNEATVLRLVGGDGGPVLYRYDPDDGALLMERLGRPMHELGLPLARRLEILCATAERIWRPAPDCGLPTGADKARWLADFIVTSWEELDRPCSEKTVDHALACAVRRAQAHRDERAVLVHGDVHQLNALQNDGGFKLIDPDGLLAEAEYDLGVLMRGDPVELLGGDPVDRARWLAARTGLDLVAIWEWGVCRAAVDRTALYPHPPTAPRPRHAGGRRGRRRPDDRLKGRESGTRTPPRRVHPVGSALEPVHTSIVPGTLHCVRVRPLPNNAEDAG